MWTGPGQKSYLSKYVSLRRKAQEGRGEPARLRQLSAGASGSYLILKVTPQRPDVQVQVPKKLT